MNKMKKSDPKKFLVRNTERPVPKTCFIIDDKKEKSKSAPCSSKNIDTEPKSMFEAPQLNSVLQIAKKIDRVENLKGCKTKSATNLAYNEKVTRKVNFPTDQAIYKDLIPLQVPAKSSPVLTAREPLPLKDKEPSLSSFIQPIESKDFMYHPRLHREIGAFEPQLNNLRLYKTLKIHELH